PSCLRILFKVDNRASPSDNVVWSKRRQAAATPRRRALAPVCREEAPGRRRGGVVTRFTGGSSMAPSSFRLVKALAVGAVGSLALVACGGNSGNGGNGGLASDQTLNFPILSDFGTLDPAVADAETDQEIQQNFQNGL